MEQWNCGPGRVRAAFSDDDRGHHARGVRVGHLPRPQPQRLPLRLRHQGPRRGTGVPGTWGLRPVLQVGLPEDPADLGDLRQCPCHLNSREINTTNSKCRQKDICNWQMLVCLLAIRKCRDMHLLIVYN